MPPLFFFIPHYIPVNSFLKTTDVTAPLKTTSTTPHWNEKYQRLLSGQALTEEGSVRKDIAICSLIGTFTEVATAWAKRIVDNYHNQARTGVSEVSTVDRDWSRNNSSSDLFNPHAAGSNGPPSWMEGEIYFHFVADYEGNVHLLIFSSLTNLVDENV